MPVPTAPPLPATLARVARRHVALRAAVVAVLVAALLAVPSPGSARAEGPRWLWPLPAPHTVLAPFEQPEHRYGAGHRGMDIAVATEGTPVRAVEAGTVRFSGQVAGRGVVSVRHADGLVSTFEPVTGVLEAGSPVRAGDVLGTLEPGSDASHCPGRACLHLGARRGEDYLDPLPLLGARGPSVLLPWGGAAGGGGRVPGSEAADGGGQATGSDAAARPRRADETGRVSAARSSARSALSAPPAASGGTRYAMPRPSRR